MNEQDQFDILLDLLQNSSIAQSIGVVFGLWVTSMAAFSVWIASKATDNDKRLTLLERQELPTRMRYLETHFASEEDIEKVNKRICIAVENQRQDIRNLKQDLDKVCDQMQENNKEMRRLMEENNKNLYGQLTLILDVVSRTKS